MAPTRIQPERQAPSSPSTRLPLPHERDETSGPDATANATPDPLMVQAHRDLEAGQVDTDLRNPAGLDAAERERLVPTPTRAPKP